MKGRPSLGEPERLAAMLPGEGRSLDEREALARLVLWLASLPPPPDPVGLYPRYGVLRDALRGVLAGGEGEVIEQAFLELYCHLHGHPAPYTGEERRAIDASGGYWCHAGGISPILAAVEWTTPDSVSVDVGAGNGLQLLLLQLLAPHRRSIQIEISGLMIEAGRALQGWLGIPPGRVEWRREDVTTCEIPTCDLLYLYRPVRPEGPGRRFYERLAASLEASERPSIILSVADCLVDFLSPFFERFRFDGHLACFRRR